MTKTRNAEFEALWTRAVAAGAAAGAACKPHAIVVGEAFDDRLDYTKRTYFVPEGVCGFAWVIVRPGTSAFARWLKANGHGRTDSYYGGVNVWISAYGQSYDRKVAHAEAMAAVLREAGVTAHANSRLD